MVLSDGFQDILIETASTLAGYDRRHFMARVVSEYGRGGQRWAERELGWNRVTVRKGLRELNGGFCYLDNFNARGRLPVEVRLPNLLLDIQDIVDSQSQTDPSFKTNRLYTRVSAAEVRQQLIIQKGYTNEELPTEETIRVKLNELGYNLKTVQKTKPKKKIPETDAIFSQLNKLHSNAQEDETVLRISMDAKAVVKIGPFSRGGKSRVEVKACDHDFGKEKLTPFTIFVPNSNIFYLYFTKKVTSDFIVDCLADFWSKEKSNFPLVTTLLINQDNGPENNSRRTQFMKRIADFSDDFQITVQLAYYPPYHSKYNPAERIWAALENKWNGSLLDSTETVLKFAQNMTWNSHHPQLVKLITKVYQNGVKLTKKQMKKLETRFQRLGGLSKWFVKISPITRPI